MKTLREIREETELPAVIADCKGLIVHVNERFTAVFGWGSQKIIGKPLTAVIPKRFHDAHHLGFSRFQTTGKTTILNKPLQLKAVTQDGTEFDAEHFIVAEQQKGEWRFGATIRPLT